MDGLGILVAVVALALGGLIGWLVASRQAAAARQVTENLRLQLDGVVRERDSANHELTSLRSANAEAQASLAALHAGHVERERGFEQQIASLEKAKETLVVQFREIGDKLLEKAQADFLAKADDRLAKADKEQSAKLQQLLQPVETTLKRYEEGLQRVEKERIDSYAGLREQVELVRAGQGQVRDEARRLVTALTSSPKQRGRWGERSLQNVLVQAGLVEGIDFNMEVSTEGEDGRLRPDAVVNLPQGRKLVIDAKCSLNAYLDACDEVDDEKRAACFKAHLASILRHAQQLGSKNYWAQFGDSADFVIMYIPGEHFLSAALEQDDQLWEKAFKDKVLLATPTNLVAIARTVASVWRQERLAAEAGKIAELGRELHSRLATMAEHIGSMGLSLSRANNAYNKMVSSLESRVLSQARKFEDHGAGSSKLIETPPMVEVTPSPLSTLAAASRDDPPQLAAE
jgi:DNA recombination protein RmuC